MSTPSWNRAAMNRVSWEPHASPIYARSSTAMHTTGPSSSVTSLREDRATEPTRRFGSRADDDAGESSPVRIDEVLGLHHPCFDLGGGGRRPRRPGQEQV